MEIALVKLPAGTVAHFLSEEMLAFCVEIK